MTDPQRSDLERILGGSFLLDQWDATVKDIEELRPAVERADVVAAVLPLELLSGLLLPRDCVLFKASHSVDIGRIAAYLRK